MMQLNELNYEKWDKEALVPCRNCGRTFLPASLKKHEKCCKPGAKRKVFTVNPVDGGLK